jgi:hypothetical protein
MRTIVHVVAMLGLATIGRAADLRSVTGFDEFAEGHQNIAKALARRPSLVQDQNYVRHHPGLAHYLHDNPLARAELESEANEEAAAPPADRARSEAEPGRRRRHPSELPRLPATRGDDADD